MDAQAQLLSGLRDIHLPEAISFWPLAPGWWLLVAVLLVAVGFALFEGQRRRRSVRRAALRELEALEAQARGGLETQEIAGRLQTLLRRVALVRKGRVEVARLHGPSWFAVLAGPDGRRRPIFPVEMARRLEEAVYAGPSADPEASEREAWIAAARRFIRSTR